MKRFTTIIALTFLLPAIIFHEGSGDWTRDDTWYSRPVDLFLKHGIAVLLYDKRGVGSSTGDWHTSSYTDLADDLLAGVRLLKSRRDINSRQIGVRGFSQGGWIASLAASRSRDVSFIHYISPSGAGTSKNRILRVCWQRCARPQLWAEGFLELLTSWTLPRVTIGTLSAHVGSNGYASNANRIL